MIYSTFAGTGKTYASTHFDGVIDLESSQYQWLNASTKSVEARKGQYLAKNPDWPQNYIQAIKKHDAMPDVKAVLISAQPEILELLAKAEIHFITVTPNADEKATYVERYRQRGNSDKFVTSMSNHFTKFIRDMDNNPHADAHIKLHHGAYISVLFR